jgi:hypothetical protein
MKMHVVLSILLAIVASNSYAQNCSSQRDYEFGLRHGLKMAPPCQPSASTAKNFIKGIDYKWSEGKCINNEGSQCLTLNEFKYMCENQDGALKFAMRAWFIANSTAYKLYENGELTAFQVTWDDRNNKKCTVQAELQGIVNGSSKRIVVNGFVSSFVVNRDGQIAIKSIGGGYY